MGVPRWASLEMRAPSWGVTVGQWGVPFPGSWAPSGFGSRADPYHHTTEDTALKWQSSTHTCPRPGTHVPHVQNTHAPSPAHTCPRPGIHVPHAQHTRAPSLAHVPHRPGTHVHPALAGRWAAVGRGRKRRRRRMQGASPNLHTGHRPASQQLFFFFKLKHRGVYFSCHK